MQPDPSYLQGLLVGIQQNQADIRDWQRDFSQKHNDDMERITARFDSLEATVTHERASRAAWNKVFGVIGTVILASITLISGALHYFHAVVFPK